MRIIYNLGTCLIYSVDLQTLKHDTWSSIN